MMIPRLFFLIAALTSTFQAFSQSTEDVGGDFNSDAVELIWKLSENDTVTYKTIMSEIEKSSFEINTAGVFGRLFDSLSIETKEETKHFFESIKDLQVETNLFTRLTTSEYFEGVIDVEMVAVPIDKVNSDEDEGENGELMKKMIRSMMKGTMLRGSIKKTGELNSFWVQSRQKNLLSLFFELPAKPLKKGDTWTLGNVNFIGNDHNFICQEAEKRNIVTLVDLKNVNNETIAVISYDIFEYVSGDFNSPALLGSGEGQKETEMRFVYKAQAEFSIERGKWISYNGVMALDASGVMESKQRQKFALIEM